jgi:transcriptional regulator with XRE-family HTH domain
MHDHLGSYRPDWFAVGTGWLRLGTMDQTRRGRPPKPLDPDASQAARLGAEIRTRREAQGLTQKALGNLIGFSPQHISQVELAQVPLSKPFVTVCDQVLEAHGSLLELFPVVTCERAMQRHDRSVARRLAAGEMPAGEADALARANFSSLATRKKTWTSAVGAFSAWASGPHLGPSTPRPHPQQPARSIPGSSSTGCS